MIKSVLAEKGSSSSLRSASLRSTDQSSASDARHGSKVICSSSASLSHLDASEPRVGAPPRVRQTKARLDKKSASFSSFGTATTVSSEGGRWTTNGSCDRGRSGQPEGACQGKPNKVRGSRPVPWNKYHHCGPSTLQQRDSVSPRIVPNELGADFTFAEAKFLERWLPQESPLPSPRMGKSAATTKEACDDATHADNVQEPSERWEWPTATWDKEPMSTWEVDLRQAIWSALPQDHLQRSRPLHARRAFHSRQPTQLNASKLFLR